MRDHRMQPRFNEIHRLPAKDLWQAEKPAGERESAENPERNRHRRRRFVEMMLLVVRPSKAAVESQVVKPVHVERGEERRDGADGPDGFSNSGKVWRRPR